MIPLSVLDLSPVPEGSDAGQALRNSLDLARHTEASGYTRHWMAEHHNMPGIAKQRIGRAPNTAICEPRGTMAP